MSPFVRDDALTSLIAIAPLFLFYHLGVLFLDVRNGVDFFTDATLRLLERSPVSYAAVTAALAAGMVWLGIRYGRGGRRFSGCQAL